MSQTQFAVTEDDVWVDGPEPSEVAMWARLEWNAMRRPDPKEWSMVPLVWKNRPAKHARILYPNALEWAQSLDARKAFFSVLPKNQWVPWHRDGPGMRFHLPIIVPPTAIVGGQAGKIQVKHREGEGYCFDATELHAFWNLESTGSRVMLVAEGPPMVRTH